MTVAHSVEPDKNISFLTKNLFRVIWEFAEGRRGILRWTYFLFIIANCLHMLQPYFLGRFFDAIQIGGESGIRNAFLFLGLFALMDFTFWVFHGPARTMERITSFHIMKNFTEKMFRIITELPMKWHKDHHSGETINKVKKASSALQIFMEDSYVYIESIIPFFIAITAILIIMKWQGLLIVIFGAIVLFAIFRFDRFLIRNFHEINRREHKAAAVLYDYMSNIVTIITLRLEALARTEFMKNLLHIYPVYRKNVIVNELKWFAISMLISLTNATIIVLYILSEYKAHGVVMVGNIVMLVEYARKFSEVFFGIAWKYEKLVLSGTNVFAVQSILDAHKRLYRNEAPLLLPSWEKISIKDIFFRHDNLDKNLHTIKNVTLELKKGEKIAFVGESGSGKSTLMTLLRGLNNAQKGNVTVDGKEFPDMCILSKITTLIPQDPEIFEDTIEYNITMGIHHQKKEVEEAMEIAAFTQVVAKLPHGIKTDIREKGVNLSGGEKQRLALSRGIFASKGSSILLLDEPTSSVDSRNERRIYTNLFKAFPEKCIIGSVHRLHLLSLFDFIYVLENGTVVESGTFDELVAQKGLLAKLWAEYEKKGEE